MPEDIKILGRIVKETELAIWFKDEYAQSGQPPVWLPKSQIAIGDEVRGRVSVTMPLWLAKHKGFY